MKVKLAVGFCVSSAPLGKATSVGSAQDRCRTLVI